MVAGLRAHSTHPKKTLQPRGGGFLEKRKHQESDRRPSADVRICGQEGEKLLHPNTAPKPSPRERSRASGSAHIFLKKDMNLCLKHQKIRFGAVLGLILLGC